MNSGRWQHIKQVLDGALAVERSEQPAYLEKACQGDLELRSEVESLLVHHKEAESGFLSPYSILQVPPTVDRQLSPLGRRLGVYELIEEIGHGGMGQVYRAARIDGQYQKQVAVKLVRGGFDTASVLERFRHERQILASLDHPNIARLLDGGTTDDGLPYLVMELIEGTPIDQHCDARALSITERLELFRLVCGAVQYAHRHLVIHRDIKPSNVLVTADGIPKLLDFGIAKILDPSAGHETTLVRALTPEYASPEQIRGEPITTATDVYSLGVVLYQLLTGHSPYFAKSSPHELTRAILEVEPERPSSVVLRLPDTVREPIHARDASTAKLHRRLVGDLDNIALMALRKEPHLRYASVEQFAEDLHRHLQGLPVIARKTSWDYRATKFIGRHKVGTLATTIAILVLFVGVIAIVRESRLAAANGRRAEQRFNDVRQLANSLIFEVHDSIRDLPGATPARKIIVQRSLEYLNRLAAESNGDLSLQRELANAYERIAGVGSSLGDITGAHESFATALNIRQKIVDSPSADKPSDQIALSASYREMCEISVRHLQNVGVALEYCSKAESMVQGVNKLYPQNTAAKMELANIYEAIGGVYGENSTVGNAGDSYTALDNHRKALAVVEALVQGSPHDLDLQNWRGRLSLLTGDDLFETGRASQAQPLYQQALWTFEGLSRNSTNNASYRRSLNISYQRMGDMLLTAGHYEESLRFYRKQLDNSTGLAAADPKNFQLRTDVAGAYATLGHALWRAGHIRESLASLRHGFDELNVGVPQASRNKGMELTLKLWTAGALEKSGDLSGALHNYLQAAATYQDICTSDPKDIEDCVSLAGTRDRIAQIYIRRNRLAEGLTEYRKGMAFAEPLCSGPEPNLEALYTMVNIYYGIGDISVARARQARTPARQTQFWKEALGWYQKSLASHKRISEWRPITPNEFDSRPPEQIEARLLQCQSVLGSTPSVRIH